VDDGGTRGLIWFAAATRWECRVHQFLTSISARIGLLLGAIALCGALLVAWSLNEVAQMRKETRRAADVLTPQLLRMSEMELTLTRISLQARHAILSRTPQELDATLAEVGALAKRLDTLFEEFGANVSTPSGTTLFAEVKGRKAHFWEQAGQVVEHVKADRRPEAFAHLVEHVVPARDA
jgi:hypothetical protein